MAGMTWLAVLASLAAATELQLPEDFAKSTHTNNWAVLVDTSRCCTITCTCPGT